MKDSFFERFDADLHRQWKQDRTLRLRVPLREAWRGCLGLGVLLARPDDTECHGNLGLVRNEQLTWLALRDVPVGQCPGSNAMNRRDVNYANTAVAELRHGMPAIDFRRNLRHAVDFKFMPFAPHLRRFGAGEWDVELATPKGDTLDSQNQQREFAVLNRMSAAMTRFAFFALDERGRPARPQWAERQPEGDYGPFRAAGPQSWMPRPHLAFPLVAEDRLYALATQSEAREWVWECPACGSKIDGTAFRSHSRAGVELFESGDFVANCVRCGKRRKWFLDDAESARFGRRFGRAFRDGFCRAVARGFDAVALGPEVYCGPVRGGDARRQDVDPAFDLVAHWLRREIDGTTRAVFLPRRASVTAKLDQRLAAGEAWAKVLGPAPAAWRGRGTDAQWRTLVDPCGGPRMLGYLQQLWFSTQMARVPSAPSNVLLPAELAGFAVREVQPCGLWWDTAPMMPHYDWETQAAVFPPLRLRRWDQLSLELPGDVVVDASIADPRFSIARSTSRRSTRNVRTTEPADGVREFTQRLPAARSDTKLLAG